MATITPVPVDTDERANRKALQEVFNPFQEQTERSARIGASPITKQKPQLMNETKQQAQPEQSHDVSRVRELQSREVNITEELRLNPSDRVIDAALSTMSHMIRVMVETDLSPKQPSTRQIISFHAASQNSTIPTGANYLRTAIDPTNTISRVHLYSRIETTIDINSGADQSDPVLERPAII